MKILTLDALKLLTINTKTTATTIYLKLVTFSATTVVFFELQVQTLLSLSINS